MTKRVLVTGGTGFIGRWAVQALGDRGYELHVCSRNILRSGTAAVHMHPIDVLVEGAMERLLTDVQPTHLLHLAWESTPGTYWQSEQNVTWAASTLILVRAAVARGCHRIVAAGTCAEYDWTLGGVLNESRSSIAPATLYGATKAACFQALQAYCAQLDVSFSWARIFYQYGPHEHPSRLVPSVVRAVLSGQPAECSHGEQLRDFLCSIDVGEALAELLDSNVGGAVNIGSGQPIRIRELVDLAASLAGNASLVRLGSRPTPRGEPLVLVPDVTRLQREVGWVPRLSLAEGLARAVTFWRNEPVSGRGRPCEQK